MTNLTNYNLAKQCDPRVFAIFERKLEGCDKDKLDKVLQRVDTLTNSGKTLQRAMADALYEFRLVQSEDV